MGRSKARKLLELERYRCNCCDEIFKAPAPEGTGADKYDETASSMVGSLRYGLGTPFFRLEKFQAGLGIPLPVGTQWQLVLRAAGLMEPAFDHLITWVAQSDVIHNDDTVMKLLERPGDEQDLGLDQGAGRRKPGGAKVRPG